MLKRDMHPVEAYPLRQPAARMRPVSLAPAAAVLQLFPMMLQLDVNFFSRLISIGSLTSAWWVHLSTAMVFGLGFATVLTLVLIPVLFAAPTVWKESLEAMRARRRGTRRPPDRLPPKTATYANSPTPPNRPDDYSIVMAGASTWPPPAVKVHQARA